MKYLKIQNKGCLDIRLVALMGGTTKSKDAFKIGQFGTGLKYTLAYLFRNSLDFKIYIGTEEVKIHLETEQIRDETFEIICINGNRTSITTKMGEDWEPWMIIRELWCNALDEGDALKAEVEACSGIDNTTTFFIQIDSEVRKVLDSWNKYFIHDVEPIFTNNNVALYPAGDHLCIYKQGVLIKEMLDVKSVYGYDLRNAVINELRQLQYSVSYCITECLYNADAKAARYFLENVTDKHYEGSDNMSYDWYGSFTEAWKDVIGSSKLIYQKVIDDMLAKGQPFDPTGFIVVPKIVYKALSKRFDGIGALRLASTINDFFEDYDEAIENKVKQAITILEHCDYVMHPDLEYRYGFFEDKTVQARISLDKKLICISKTLLQKPLFTIVAMLIEENEHFNTGMADHTREFQQHFIDLYTRALLAKNEVEI